MEIQVTLLLPRDELTVPVARKIVDSSLRAVGVTDDCVSDVLIALSEACTNVLQHSGPGEEYEVRYRLHNDTCSIEVADLGRGFDADQVGAATPEAERGRGVQLMRALVDRVRFESKPTKGSLVHLEKTIDTVDGSLLDRAVKAEA